MISKKTIDEVLELYLKEKGLSSDSIENIKKNLHKDIKCEDRRSEVKPETTQTVHGTSCPRILNKFGELVVEL